jgi:transglutaminase/protease-like cytokinesis protein 3
LVTKGNGSHYRYNMKIVFIILIVILSKLLSGQHPDFIDHNFEKLDSIALAYQFKGTLNPEKIAKDLTKNLRTDLDKFRVIFRWIAENISYDMILAREVTELSTNPKKYTSLFNTRTGQLPKLISKKLFKERLAICSGYAWLLDAMCNHAGLNCEIVTGYARDSDSKIGQFRSNHAWNAILIKGKWYLADATWAAGSVDKTRNKFYREFDKIYFLADPEYFVANHYPVDVRWLLLKSKLTIYDFFDAPLKTSAFIKNKISNYSPSQGAIKIKKDSVLNITFSSNREIKRVSTETRAIIDKKLETSSFFPAIERNAEGRFVIRQPFTRKGNYVLNIFVNNFLSLVYTVQVF